MIRFGGAKIDEWRKLVYVQEILDATRFVGVWRGQTYECRAAPSTSGLTVGETVVCHVMPGSSELIAVTRETSEMLFLGTGYMSGPDRGQLYRWDGTAAAAVLAWAPADCYAITALAVVGEWLYIAVYDVWVNEPYLYKWLVADAIHADVTDPAEAGNVPTLIGAYEGWHDPRGYYLGEPCNQMAWWGNKLYLAHGSWFTDYPHLNVYDPATGNISLLLDPVDNTGGFGGLGVSHNRLYWCSGNYIFSSPDGAAWVQDYDMIADLDRCLAGGFVTDPVNDKVYFNCVQSSWGVANYYLEIIQIAGDGTVPAPLVVVDQQDTGPGSDDAPRAHPMTIRYSGVSPSKIYCARWYDLNILEGDANAPVGSFAEMTAAVPGNYVAPGNQSMLIFRNKVTFYGYNDTNPADMLGNLMLFQYDPTTGAVTTPLASFTFHNWSLMNWLFGPFPLAVTPTVREVHEQ